MIKYFCDKCGNEITTTIRAVPIYARDSIGVTIAFIGYNHLCEECAKKFDEIQDQLEYEEDFFN